MQGKQVLYPHH
ncbi:unnamed protein product, partial [Allacma fusca]